MQFGILGPLEVLHDGRRVQLGGVRRRAVLARLLVDPGRPVTADRLIDDVWADEPPATARKNLQKYVSELRSLLPELALVTTPGGYRLDVAPEFVDAPRFERLVASGDFAVALELWRGDVLADLPAYSFVAAERTRLGELHLLARQGSVEQHLSAGRHEEVVVELTELLDAHPDRERLVELQMLALYRSGRQGEALAAFTAYRDRLAGELGVEPGGRLRDLQVSILRQEAELQAPTSRTRTDNLPHALTTFVGRRAELSTLAQRLSTNRLVTLTGVGGAGKTRLAVEAARNRATGLAGGAWLVDLAEVSTGDQVPTAVALGLRTELRHAPDEPTAIEARLGGAGPCLVVLDNCEHVVNACAVLLRRILRSCPDLTVLATSRRPLGVEGEYVLPLGPLEELEAVQLFVERGQLTGQLRDGMASAPTVTGLCQRLDGLPLAIELAASQLRVLSLEELSARMDDRLTFRGAGAPVSERQGTLRDMVTWSHDLLPAGTQEVFARCGVFLGTLSLRGVEAVCAEVAQPPATVLEHVTTLVDHSLLLRVGDTAPDSRYRLLETLRLFALDRLAEAGVVDETRRAHAAYVREVAAEAADHVRGPDEREWLARLDVEAANVEVALAWAAEHDWPLAVDLAVALWPYWDAGWGERAAVAYLERLLAEPPPSGEDRRYGWANLIAADMAANQGDARKGVPWGRAAMRVFETVDDDLGRACAAVALGSALGGEGALVEAAEMLAEATEAAYRLGDDVLAARSLNRRHFVAARMGDHDAADELGQAELDLWAKIGSPRGEATALRHLAVNAFRFGDLDQAERLCERAMTVWRQVDDRPAVAHVQTTQGDIARERGDVPRATALYRAALVDLQAIGDRRCEASTCKNLADILCAQEAHEQSARLFRAGITLRHELGDAAGLAECFEGLAATLRSLERPDDCATLLGAAAELREVHELVPTDAEQEALHRLGDAARSVLDPAVFERSWHRGREMDVDEVVEFALHPSVTPSVHRAGS